MLQTRFSHVLRRSRSLNERDAMRTFQTCTLTNSGLPNTIKAHVSLSRSIIMKRCSLPSEFVGLHLQHGSTALVDLGRVVSFLIYRLDSLGWGSATRKAATHTQDSTNRINAHRHPCLECDSNPRSQCTSKLK
jgi:hypothetical protein